MAPPLPGGPTPRGSALSVCLSGIADHPRAEELPALPRRTPGGQPRRGRVEVPSLRARDPGWPESGVKEAGLRRRGRAGAGRGGGGRSAARARTARGAGDRHVSRNCASGSASVLVLSGRPCGFLWPKRGGPLLWWRRGCGHRSRNDTRHLAPQDSGRGWGDGAGGSREGHARAVGTSGTWELGVHPISPPLNVTPTLGTSFACLVPLRKSRHACGVDFRIGDPRRKVAGRDVYTDWKSRSLSRDSGQLS